MVVSPQSHQVRWHHLVILLKAEMYLLVCHQKVKTRQNKMKKKKKLPKNQKPKNKTPGSVGIIQCLPTFHKTLGLISSTSKDKTKPVSHAKPPKPQL